MATGMTDTFEGQIIDHFLRNTAQTSPTAVYLALYSAAPGESTAGTELTGNGYAREAITFGADTNGVTNNTNTITYTAAGGAWSAVAGHAICDASTAGNILFWDDTAGPTLSDGDSYEFGASDVTVTLT